MKYFETKKEYEDYSTEGLVSGDVCYVVEDKSAHFRTNNIDGTNKTYDVGGNESGDVVLVTKNITENGSYTPEDADGYSSVNVNVPIPEGYINPEGTVEITSNGTTNVRNFNSATVNVQPDLVEETITQNGVYLPSPADGYSKVTVSVHQNELIEATFTENGSYTPTDADGYSTVNVNVPIPEGYIKPTGDINITANGTVNVNDYKMAVVNVPIPEGYIKPSGTKDIYENGNNIDVNNYKAVNVNVPQPSGRIEITENGDDIDIANYALANVNVPIPEGYIKPTGNLNVTSNGSVNVKTYETATVNVQPDLVQGNITTNGTHTPTGYDGYSSVTVNVQPDLTTETITENGTHTPTGYDGYSEVTVNVPQPSGNINITENGNVNVNDYSTATVDVQPDLTTETITENGTYIPTGYDGYSQVTVNVSGGQEAIDLLERNVSSYTIPNGTTSIGDYAFYNFTTLQSVTIPDSVTIIGQNSFYGCSNLTDVTIGNGVTSIGVSAFEQCASLTNVTIGSGVTSIGQDAFNGCTGLTSVTIPDSVTSIGSNAFADCSGLLTVIVEPTTPITIGTYVFSSNASGRKIYVPDASLNAYKTATNWSTYASNIYPISDLIAFCKLTLNDGTGVDIEGSGELTQTMITDKVEDKNTITKVELGKQCTSIGMSAFSQCTGLTSVNISNSVTSIGNNAFNICRGLTEITIPDNVTSIGSGAFNGCSGLTSVTIGSGVTSIGASAFSSAGFTEIVIPDSVTSIGANAFISCSKLTSVTVTRTTPPTLGSRAFDYSASGRKIYVPSAKLNTYKSATNWKTYANDIYAIS